MQSLIPILAIVLIFSPKLVGEVKDYLLRKEQIKADTELRAEALRLKNSLELDKFIENSNNEATYNQNSNSDTNDDSFDTIRRRRDSKYQ
jgi:hypothetical protein